MTFGEKLKSSRQSKNLTQKQIASALDIDQTNISNWEHNKNLPSPPVLIKLANILEISLDYLLTEEGENLYKPKNIKIGDEINYAPKTEVQELFDSLNPTQQKLAMAYMKGLYDMNEEREVSNLKNNA